MKKKRAKFYKWRVLVWIVVVLSVFLALCVSEIGGRCVRYLIYLWPFFGIILVDGAWKLWKNNWGKVIIITLVLIWGIALYHHCRYENNAIGEREVAHFLLHSAQAGDVIIVKGALAGGEQAVANYYLIKKIKVFDYYSDYKPGKLAHERESIDDIITRLANSYSAVWYYDFTYGTVNIEPQGYFSSQRYLGLDKEQKEVVIYRVEKQ